MTKNQCLKTGLVSIALAASAGVAMASNNDQAATNYCMDVEIEPFHMVPDGSCAVRDYWEGELQKRFYPFTSEDHQFNCEVFGEYTPLPTGDLVPSSVRSESNITGTIGGHPFSADLLCASQTNWYAHFCEDPSDDTKPCFQLAQPFFNVPNGPFPRVTEVSVFDGVITVQKNKHNTMEVPILMATRAAGITHLEVLDPPQVGASITHGLLGLVTYDAEDEVEYGDNGSDRDIEVLDGSADMLLQGHIFYPGTVEEDPGAAVIRGSICSKDLYKRLNRKGGHGHHD